MGGGVNGGSERLLGGVIPAAIRSKTYQAECLLSTFVMAVGMGQLALRLT